MCDDGQLLDPVLIPIQLGENGFGLKMRSPPPRFERVQRGPQIVSEEGGAHLLPAELTENALGQQCHEHIGHERGDSPDPEIGDGFDPGGGEARPLIDPGLVEQAFSQVHAQVYRPQR